MQYYIKRNVPNYFWGAKTLDGSYGWVETLKKATLFSTYAEAEKVAKAKARVGNIVCIKKFFGSDEENYNRAMEIL